MLFGDRYLFIYPTEVKNCSSVHFSPACLLLWQLKTPLTNYFAGFFQLVKTQSRGKTGTRLCDANALFLTSFLQHGGLLLV